MKKKFFKWTVLTLLVAGVLAGGWFYGIKPLIAKIKGDVIDPNDVVEVTKDTVEITFKSSGTVTAKQDIKVTSKPSGILKAVYVKEGEYVKKGQKVGLVKPGRNEFEDYKPMPIYTEASGTVVKCLDSDNDRDLSERDLSLPRLGTFLNGSYDAADKATCFLRVVNMDILQIPIYVSEQQVMKLKKGMFAEVQIASLGNDVPALKGTVSHVSTQTEKSGSRWSDSKGFLVIVELPRENQNILLGVNASITVPVQKKENVLVIPANALFEKEGKSYAFKYLGGNKTEKTEIETGLSNDKLVEVTKGLAEHDKVLTVLPYGESW